jgi:4-hydroxybenzoate polyprenyltransferase
MRKWSKRVTAVVGVLKGLVITIRPKIGLVTLPWVGAMALFASMEYGDFSAPIYFDSEFLITLLLIMMGSYLGVTSGYAVNDFFDAELDTRSGRKDKAVESGINKMNLMAYSAILGIPSLIILFYLNILTGLVGILQMLFIVTYSNIKYRSAFSNIFVVLPTALMPIGVFFIYTNSISIEAILFFILYFFYEPGFTWSAVVRDTEHDKKKGVPTLPVKYGIFETAMVVFVCWTFVLMMSIFLFFFTDLGILYLFGSSLSAIMLIRLANNLVKNPIPSIGAKTFFKSARWFWFFSLSLIFDLLLQIAGVSLLDFNLLG